MLDFEKLSKLQQQLIWDRDYTGESPWVRIPIAIVRTLLYLYREFSSGELNLRAMSLVYTTILSLVPLLAFSFSVLKGFGVQNQIEPLLIEYFAALGPEKSAEITERIVEFVDNIDVRVLGAVGLALLVYTIITLIQKIEAAFNRVWHVRTQRSFAERFSTFISVLTVGPLLVFAALAITASVTNIPLMQSLKDYEPFGTIAAQFTRFTPYVLVISAFTFFYVLIPNTKVRLLPALAGGVVAGLLWQTAGFVFAYFVSSATKYQAVYATFGTALFFMIWLYVSWLILLVGASIAYYVQQPRIIIARARNWRFSCESFEGAALAAMIRMVRDHYAHGAPLTLETMSNAQKVPPEMIEKVLSALETERLISRTADQPPGFVLAVPPEETTVAEVVGALRRHQDAGTRKVELSEMPVVETLLGTIDRGIEDALGDMTLKTLAQSDAEEPEST
jgi:membrane protein